MRTLDAIVAILWPIAFIWVVWRIESTIGKINTMHRRVEEIARWVEKQTR